MSIYITGGAGFIGSNLVEHLNSLGECPTVFDNITEANWKNLAGLKCKIKKPEEIFGYLLPCPDALIHLGANIDTTEKFNDELWANNVLFSQRLFAHFCKTKIIYASSGAVYGAEEKYFAERCAGLKPLNPYAMTKLYLDIHLDKQVALRFFNVYGPNEGHKGEMASVISKAINWQKQGHDSYSLFNTQRVAYRDFIYVGDICKVITYFIESYKPGIYNVGTGQARTFKDILDILKMEKRVIPLPESLRINYQYFTQADITKLRVAGYDTPFLSLEEGIKLTQSKS